MPQNLSIDLINSLHEEDFVREIGPVFEGPPWIARAAWNRRPFVGIGELHAALCDVMYGASPQEKEALIRAHPDLVGQAALAGTLSRDSTREQASAGLDDLSAEEIARFQELNSKYRHKFGFPFVICARENKKESILAGFQERMDHSREEEIDAALREVCKIAWLRLLDKVTPGD